MTLPSRGIFTPESQEKISSIEIVNLLGEKIYSTIQQFNNSTIDLSDAPNGVYFIQLSTGKGVVRKKVVISH